MDDKRTAILQATLTLISERGFHGTPMSKVAEKAGVGAGTIYRYFENKEALINELFRELKQELSQAIFASVDENAPSEEIFRSIWWRTVQYCIEHPVEVLFLEQYHNSPFLTPETEAQTQAYLAPVIQLVQQGIDSGAMKAMPFEMVSVFVFDLAVLLSKHHNAGALTLDDQSLELAMQACWDAVKCK